MSPTNGIAATKPPDAQSPSSKIKEEGGQLSRMADPYGVTLQEAATSVGSRLPETA